MNDQPSATTTSNANAAETEQALPEAPPIGSIFAPGSFANRIVIITGAAHGIGKATARRLADLGAHAIALDNSQDNLERLHEDLAEDRDRRAQSNGGPHGDVYPMYGDVTVDDDLQATVRLANELAATHGATLTGLINNALLAEHGDFETRTPDQVTRVWQTNTLSAWRLVQLALPHLDPAGSSVVNMSSIMAHRPSWPCAAYASAKAAVEGLTRAMAVELGPKRIRVNCVMPGPISTRERRNRKYDRPNPGVPDDVWEEYRQLRREYKRLSQALRHPWPDAARSAEAADPIIFLLSEGARFITGTALTVDGGTLCYDGMFVQHSEELEALGERYRAIREKYPELDYRRWRESQDDKAEEKDG